MKNLYLKLFSVLFLGFIGISTYAQGTWKAIGTEVAISPSTEITIMGITSLSCMHSDASSIVGKSDATPTVVTYNGITWDNLGLLQGSTNDMFYAFLPSVSGTLDINAKMGSGKKSFILELTDACWTFLGSTGNLALLTSTFPTVGNILATPAYFTTPSVYDTYHASSGTWDGSATSVFQSSGSNVWTVMSFAVTAGKTYVIGVIGSKFMLRGVSLAVTTSISDYKAPQIMMFPNPAVENVSINVVEPSQIGIYNSSGMLMKHLLVSPPQNSINISDLNPGLYFVRMNNNKTAQKLIVR
jgi:hypothetical protein